MNLLIVSTRPPLPVTKGDQVILRNRIRELSRRGHRVFLCYLHSGASAAPDLGELRGECAGVYPHAISPWRQLANLGAALFSRVPLQVALYSDPGFTALVSEVIERERIDLVDAFLIRPFAAVEDVRVPLVVDLIDSMLLNVQRRMDSAPFWLKPVLRIESRRLARFEKLVCARAASSVVVGTADGERIGGERVFVVPLGVNTREFHPDPGARIRGRVVFSGNMNYHANKHALAWFLESCWERIRAAHPEAELCVVGAGSERLARALRAGEATGVRILGRVPSMGDVLRTADVSVAPMQSGSGMQNKVLEAMACGVPTVVSRLGLGDIAARDGFHTLVADEPAAVVAAVCRLLSDEPLRQRIAAAATQLVHTRYTWAANASEFEAIADRCLRDARRAGERQTRDAA